jgi:mono/diheme cytochrome c family protein
MMKPPGIPFLLGIGMVLLGRTGSIRAEEVFTKSIGTSDVLLAASSSPGSNEAQSRTQTNLPRRFSDGVGLLLAVKNEPAQTRQGGAVPSEARHPTYLRDVLPIFIGKCFRCHNDQTRFLNNWTEYNAALADRWEIRRRVWNSWKGGYFKQPMPTVNSPESEAMTEEERTLIKDWIDAGALRGVQPAQSNPRSKTERLEVGRTLFTTICAACHQPTGQGIPNRFPPLAGSDFLNSNKERAIGVLLHGLQGEVVVNGQKFNNSMPLLPLGDGQIAAALTYVYNSFGNSGKDVTPEEVKALRSRNDGLISTPEQVKGTISPAEKSPWE